MRGTTNRLSARTVETKKKPGVYADGAGLYLRIRPSGSKSWILVWHDGGKRREYRPHAFEQFAADIVRLMDPNVVAIDVTRASRDGGRDAVGKYRIGQTQNCVTVDFAMEAKCYKPSSGLGVEVMSRLISRLRHRQFGMLVTTSYLGDQPYKEIVEDEHPIVVCSGGDLAELLISKRDLASASAVTAWLNQAYPTPVS